VPGKEAFSGELRAEVLGRVQHHLNDTIDISIVVIFQSTDIQPQSTREGGSDVFGIEHYSFNCAGFDGFRGKHLQGRTPLRMKTIALHLSEQNTLVQPDAGKRGRDGL
jgi:hypothetical protein